MSRVMIVLLLTALCCVCGKPLEETVEIHSEANLNKEHKINKRFINPMFNLDGDISNSNFARLRSKRSEGADECEKLQLCKLHARSSYNFLAAYELYFVNKENARLWDHHARSLANCEKRYGDCYER